nr:ATP synthase F0 subunit 8 [Tropiduchidae sp. 1 WQW-2023a]
MPQMSPIMWTAILTLTSMMIMQMNSYLYFETMKKSPNMKKKTLKKINWKW